MERQFEVHLEKLRSRIMKMSILVEDQLELAIRAIEEGNEELAKLVRERETKVNDLDRKIDKTCQKIIALSQPVAIDLRLVISALTINTNLERIGDLAENMVWNVSMLGKKQAFLANTKFREMADITQKMVKYAIESFNTYDHELAKKVIEMDDSLDKLFAENRELLIKHIKSDTTVTDEALAVLEVCRHLERVGDHSTNIAEDVYFIVEAQLIKHKHEKYIFLEIDNSEDDD